MKLIAHRGYKTNNIKENTLEAFTNAFNNGFIGIECDVRKTKDNELVICHDYFIDRVSNGTGSIGEHTYEELLKYNFGSKEVPSKISTLKEVLTNYSGFKIIELKEEVNLDKIVDFIDDKTFFMSFNTSYMLKLKKKYPKLKVGILNYVLNSINNYQLDMIAILDIISTENIINSFLKRNIPVFIYGIGKTVNIKIDGDDVYYISDRKNLN